MDLINSGRCFRSSECKVEATHFLRQSESMFLCEKLNVARFHFSLQITIFFVAVTGARVQTGQKSTQIAWGEKQTVSPIQWSRRAYLRCELPVWKWCERLVRINCGLVSTKGKALTVSRMSLPNVKDQFQCCYSAHDSGCDSTWSCVLTFCSISICLYPYRRYASCHFRRCYFVSATKVSAICVHGGEGRENEPGPSRLAVFWRRLMAIAKF